MAVANLPSTLRTYNAQNDVVLHAFVTLGTGKTVETNQPLLLPKGSLPKG